MKTSIAILLLLCVSVGDAQYNRFFAGGGSSASVDSANFVKKTGLPLFNVMDYGAVGNGSTDDAAAIRAADVAAFAAGGIVYAPAKTYRINSKVMLRGNVDMRGAIFNTSDTTITAIQYGDSGTIQHRKIVFFPSVQQNIHTNGAWPTNTNCIGIRIIGAYTCEFHIPFIEYFSRGLVLGGVNKQTVSYSEIHLGHLASNKINLHLQPVGTGFVNENLFLNGRFDFYNDDGLDIVGARHILIDSSSTYRPNQNIFTKSSIEGSWPAYSIENWGANNVFNDCRWEPSSSDTVKIWYRAMSASVYATRNIIRGGAYSKALLITNDTYVAGNHLQSDYAYRTIAKDGFDSSAIAVGRVRLLCVGGKEAVDSVFVMLSGASVNITFNIYSGTTLGTATDSLFSSAWNATGSNAVVTKVSADMKDQGRLGNKYWWFKPTAITTKPLDMILQLKGHQE